MELYLLKVKHIYDEEFEDCGIFSSKENLEKGKKEYLKHRKKESFKKDEFRFTYTKMTLDTIEY